MPSGRAFVDRTVTASFAACGSRPTGRSRRRSSCGAARSDRAGRRSPSTAISSTPRSSSARTRSSPATTLHTGEPVWQHRDRARFWEASRRRRAARDADSPRRSRLHLRCDRNPQRARCPRRFRRVVARVRYRARADLGVLELTGRRRRTRRGRRYRHTRRLRLGHRRAALDGPGRQVLLQLAASGDDRRRIADPAHERSRRHECRSLGMARCSGSTSTRATVSCSRP